MEPLKQIVYPISINYREHWNTWGAIRELVQNSLDSCSNFQIYKNGSNLIISDNGEGLQIKHLLFGVSEKEHEGLRGKFGEGLKIALIVLKRLGYETIIQSGNLKIETDTEFFEDIECLKLQIYKTKYHEGTKITIKNYNGETFKDRFTHNRTGTFQYCDDKIFDDDESKLYVKNIFVQKLENAAFSYDIWNCDLEESRSLASTYDVNYGIGTLWENCNDESLIKKFLNAVKNEKKERDAKLSYINPENHILWKNSWKAIFGSAVIGTDEQFSQEAIWRGAKIVDLPYNFRALYGIIGTDQSYVIKHHISPKNEIKVKGKKLKMLKRLQNYVDKINYDDVKVKAYRFTNITTKGEYCRITKEIRINHRILNNAKKSIATLIHELAHSECGTKDLTHEHFRAIADIGASLIIKNRRQ